MRKTINNLLAVTFVLCLISCETSELSGDNSKDLIDAATLSEHIKDVIIEPVTEDLEGDYKISLRFKESLETERMPDVFKLCGFSGVEPLSKSADQSFLYTSITSNERIKKMYVESIDKIDQVSKVKGFEIGCKVSITSPGQYDKNCRQNCSDESLLGGSTWFCVCVYECEIGWK